MNKSLIISSITVLALIGCSGIDQGEPQQNKQPDVTQNQQPSKQPDPTQNQQQAEKPKKDQKELSEIKEHLQIGQSQEEVKTFLGESFVELTSAKDNKPLWRYDFGAQSGYKPTEQDDFVDIEALQKGNLELQVFVTWSEEGTVERVALYYLNPSDAKVYEYRIFPDGTVRETAIA